jgi:hypothetical protein
MLKKDRVSSTMSRMDGLKEELSYLKLWQGMLVVTGLSLVAWLVTNFQKAHWLIITGAIISFTVLAFGCVTLHRRIAERIREMERL